MNSFTVSKGYFSLRPSYIPGENHGCYPTPVDLTISANPSSLENLQKAVHNALFSKQVIKPSLDRFFTQQPHLTAYLKTLVQTPKVALSIIAPAPPPRTIATLNPDGDGIKGALSAILIPDVIPQLQRLEKNPTSEIWQSLPEDTKNLIRGIIWDVAKVPDFDPLSHPEGITFLNQLQSSTYTPLVSQLIAHLSAISSSPETPNPFLHRSFNVLKTDYTPLKTPSKAIEDRYASHNAVCILNSLIQLGMDRNETGHIKDYVSFQKYLNSYKEYDRAGLVNLVMQTFPLLAPNGAETEADTFDSEVEYLMKAYPDIFYASGYFDKMLKHFEALNMLSRLYHDIKELNFSEKMHPNEMIERTIRAPLYRALQHKDKEEKKRCIQNLQRSLAETYDEIRDPYHTTVAQKCEEWAFHRKTPPDPSLGTVPTIEISEVLQKKRILLVSNEIRGVFSTGGLGTYIDEVAETLASRGYDITVVTPDFTGQGGLTPEVVNHVFDGRLIETKVRSDLVKGYECVSFTDDGFYRLYDLKSMPGNNPYRDEKVEERSLLFSAQVATYVQNHADDIGIVINNDWHAALLPELLAQKASKQFFEGKLPPILQMIHNASPGSQGHMKGRPPTLSAIKYASHMATVSHTHAHELSRGQGGATVSAPFQRGLHNKHAFGIQNGTKIDITTPIPDFVQYKADKKNALERLIANDYPEFADNHFNPTGRPVLLYVGRCDEEQKGISRLKAAMEAARAQGAALIVMGSEETAAATAALDEMGSLAVNEWQPRVATDGHYDWGGAIFLRDHKIPVRKADGTEKWQYRLQQGDGVRPGIGQLAREASDIGLYLSHFEPSGLTQLELMPFGLKAVYTPVGGLKDTLEEVGTAVNFAHPEGIYTAIKDATEAELVQYIAASDEEKANEMQRIRTHSARFSWEHRIEDLLKVCQYAIQENRFGPTLLESYPHLGPYTEPPPAAGAGAGAGGP